MSYNPKKAVLDFILLFVLSLVLIYLVKNVDNYFISAVILAISILIFILTYQSESKKSISLIKEGFMRYTLLCHNCNWEWMSNVTDKKYSNKCPNCGDNSKIETIGIRRVYKLPKRSNKDLTSYFNK